MKFNAQYCKSDDGSTLPVLFIISSYEPLKTASCGAIVACSLQFRICLQGKTEGGLLF